MGNRVRMQVRQGDRRYAILRSTHPYNVRNTHHVHRDASSCARVAWL